MKEKRKIKINLRIAIPVVAAVCLLVVAGLVALGPKLTEKRWLCTYSVQAGHSEPLLDEQGLKLETKEMYIQNCAKADLTLLLFQAENLETPVDTASISAGGVVHYLALDPEQTYYLGIQAQVEEDREIQLIVTNHPNATPYQIT